MNKKSVLGEEKTNLAIIKDESGIALLMSLGVLSLLIVLSLAFAVRTMNSMKGVKLSQNLVKVRLFDETGFQKMYSILSGEFADPNDEDNLFPATKDGQSQFFEDYSTTLNLGACWYSAGVLAEPAHGEDSLDIDTAMYMTVAGQDYTPDNISSLIPIDADPAERVGWIHILDEAQDHPDNDTPIAARISFIIVDESGKIDPWAVQQPGVAEGGETRIGQNVDEINLDDVVGSTLAGKLTYTADSPKWYSYYNIYKLNAFDIVEADNIRQNLFPHSYDIEAFSTPKDGKMVNKHRFNLGARDDDTNWWDKLGEPPDTDPKIDTILQDAADFEDDNIGGIPWLFVAYDDGGQTDTQIRQVAANIIDYNDDDDIVNVDDTASPIATSDWDGMYTNIPTYCGNEKVPYISEIEFSLELDSAGAGGDLDLDARAELINIFSGLALGASGRLTVTTEVSGIDDSGNFTETLTFSWDFSNIFNTTPTSSGDYYHTLAWNGLQNIGGHDSSENISNFTITVISAVLEDDSGPPRNLWDFSVPDVSPVLNPATIGTQTISVEVDDPRYNLHSTEWLWRDWDAGNTIGAVNTNFRLHDALLTEKDQEPATVTEPWQVSTNFIRNAPMNSLWELGAIHRGAPWQTINLKTSNVVSAGQLDEAVFGNYDDGDAYILSQVKLSNDTEVIGRININTYNQSVLEALFEGIMVGNDYNNVDPGDAVPLSDTNAGTIATQILQENGTAAGVGRPFLFRGEIAEVDELANMSGIAVDKRDTDREQEEIIGKMVTLTTVRSNYFTAIITSQIVKDMIQGYKGGSRGIFDEGIDEVIAEQRLLTVLYRDALTKEFKLIRYEYLDQ